MNRLYISFAIIISVLLLDVFSHNLMKNEETDIEKRITVIQEYINSGNTESAISESENLLAEWEKTRKKLEFFVSDKNLDDIGDSIAKIKPLLDSGSDEAVAETEHIKRRLHRTHTRDLPLLHNVF